MHYEVGDAPPKMSGIDERGARITLPVPGARTVAVFYRGEFCPYCNGQLASYARSYPIFEQAGAAVVGVCVDSPEKNAAMVEKLLLPFSILSDPSGDIIKAYDLWNPVKHESHPAILVFDEAGVVRYAYYGRDFMDRPGDSLVFEALGVDSIYLDANGIATASKKRSPSIGDPIRRAVTLDQLIVAYRMSLHASGALKLRIAGLGTEHRPAANEVRRFQEMISGYGEALFQTARLKEEGADVAGPADRGRESTSTRP